MPVASPVHDQPAANISEQEIAHASGGERTRHPYAVRPVRTIRLDSLPERQKVKSFGPDNHQRALHETAAGLSRRSSVPAGRMFWLKRNRLTGS